MGGPELEGWAKLSLEELGKTQEAAIFFSVGKLEFCNRSSRRRLVVFASVFEK